MTQPATATASTSGEAEISVSETVTFLALDPRQVLDGYRCELSDGDRARIGADAATPLLWMTLVSVEANGAVSVNLRAPIVINPKTMMGQQVLPHDCVYPLRHVLVEANRVRRCSYSPVAATRRS